MNISVIIPLHNEHAGVEELHAELAAVLDGIGRPSEILLVDDGSTDDTAGRMRACAARDPRVMCVELERRYGQTAALLAGIHAATGVCIVTMDGDLQNDPRDIPALLAVLDRGADVVCGWRRARRDPLLRTLLSRAANALISVVAGVHLHDVGCALRVYRAEYIRDVVMVGETHRLLPVYCAINGARIAEQPVNHRPRKHGTSHYGMGRIIKVAADLLVVKYLMTYFTRPMYVFAAIALALGAAAVAIWGFVAYRALLLGGQWLSPLFFIGLLIGALGIISVLMGLLADMAVRLYFEMNPRRLYRRKTGGR